MDKPTPDAGQEVDWIKRVQQGEQEPFGLLIELHQRRVFSIIYHLIRRRDDVEDIAQEIFIKAFQAIRSYNFESSFGTWLSRVSVNHCYDYLRRLRSSRVRYFWEMGDEARLQLEARAEREGEAGLNQEDQMVLKEFTTKLLERAPVEDQVVLGLKELEDLSVEEIAEIMSLKVSTVKVRLHRARKRMLKDVMRMREGR
ncbi:MAG TPA: sigma-70 family RNA polymerase sigma factor [Terriglobia bacterium]|nr:sigma-70 family RNA polymerase sigma factor [Terriglobia bacterium]